LHPLAYFSTASQGSQLNWSATEKEAYALVMAVQHWYVYLAGNHFTLHSDHNPLNTFTTLKILKGKIGRWLSELEEVEIVHSNKSSVVIPKLDKIFTVHGIPFELTPDNGPSFNGDQFSRYLKLLGEKSSPSTPKWPQSNEEVEPFMQPLAKALTIAVVEGRNGNMSCAGFYYSTEQHRIVRPRYHLPNCQLTELFVEHYRL